MGGNGQNQATIKPGASADQFVSTNQQAGTKSLLTIPIIGYVNKSSAWNCSFPVSKYGVQQSVNPYVHPNGDNCGNGVDTQGKNIVDTDPLANNIQVDPNWMRLWIQHLIATHSTAAKGGVQIYQMDNEPSGWGNTHRDVHPQPTGYDELVNDTIPYAAMIKATDASAQVDGSSDFGYPAYIGMGKPGDNSTSHGIGMAEYYLQQMYAYQKQHGVRLLDYFDEHYYPASSDACIANCPAGDAKTQAEHLQSTRSLWDPNYKDNSWIGQYYPPIQLIPTFHKWVNKDYPGTKTAITEYNFGGMESVNGALTEADVLGIFGRENLDLATLWGPPKSTDPGAYAFRMYRNYDGKGSMFGNTSVQATSADQGKLAIYGALRGSDGALTLMIINKTGGDLSSNLSLKGFNPAANAQVYTYSSANTKAIVRQPDHAVSANGFQTTYAANSITLVVLPGSGHQSTGPRPTPTPKGFNPTPKPTQPTGNNGPWSLIYSDDFNGTTLNPTWGLYDGPHNGGKSYYKPNEVWVSNGQVHIQIEQKETGGLPYTSGGMAAFRLAQTYGKYEFRARLPKGKGVGPYAILWENTPGHGDVEVDLFESPPAAKDKVYFTNHGNGQPSQIIATGNFGDTFHTFSYDTQTLCWRPVIPFYLDVAEFEQRLALADTATRQHNQHVFQTALEEADGFYRGELLPGCYDEWILPERERLRKCHWQVLEQLLRHFEEQGDSVTAIHYAQRMLGLDSLSEDLYRRLMRLFASNNDRASALHVYHTCVTTLQREMGIDPDPATREAYERLLQQETSTIQTLGHQSLLVAPPALIGRESEWKDLHGIWQYVRDGTPHFVLITGEAGVGKSRLAEEFLRWASQQGAATAKARSYAAEGQLSLAPVTEWLRSEALRIPLRQLDTVWLTELVRLLPELLVEQPDLPHYEPVTEYGQRQRFFEALACAMLIPSQPLLLLIDDLQWCDQETLAWLHFLLRFDPKARLLVIGCVREEELQPQHPLHTFLLHLHNSSMSVTDIALAPLDAAETTKLAAQVAKRKLDISEGLRLYHETQGYPLFVVEIVRADLEREATNLSQTKHLSGQLPLDDARTIPPRMHAVLASRLLQLSAAARVFVELAAIIGREFTLDLLIAISTADAESAVYALDELWRKRIVSERGANRYDFTHDKLREVAYAEISAPQRRRLHLRVAQVLEARHIEDLDSVSGQLAWHYERAGVIEQALPYYQRAAALAQSVYANEDAINLILRSLALLELLPASTKRDKKELDLQLALAPIYRVTKGWTVPELEHVLDRAHTLCDRVGNDAQRAQTLYGLLSMYVVQARLERVQMVYDELHTLYQHSLGTAPLFSSMMMTGVRMHMGKLMDANAQFTEIIASHDPDQILHVQVSQGVNYAAHARAWQSHTLWCLGYPQQALNLGLDAVKLVQDLDQPFNQALVSAYLALLQQLCSDETVARGYAEQALVLTSKYQAPYYRAWATILVNYAQALEHPDEERIEHLRSSITEFKASGARLRLPYYLSLLSHIYQKAGRAEEGLLTIDEALREARTHNERWWDAEIHRLRGELLLLRGAEPSDVEAALLRAIEIARFQQTKSLELRATMSLARLWCTLRRSTDARRWLQDVYDWFTEGFETPDLKAARLLLLDI